MPFAALVEPFHHRGDDCSGLRILKSNEFEIGGEHADVALAEIFDRLRRMLERREAEEGGDRLGAERDAHRGDALFDFSLGFVRRHPRQVLVRPGVRADGVTGGGPTCFMISGCQPACLPIGKNIALGALFGQRLEYRRGVYRPRAIVEREDHFVVAQGSRRP